MSESKNSNWCVPTPEKVRTLLLVRADRIGDHILGSSLFPILRKAYPSARIIVACPADLRELHEHRPEIDQVITFDRERGHHSMLYRWGIIRELRRLKADLVINPQLTRDKLSSRLTVYSGAACKVGFDAELRGMMKPRQWRRYQAAFDHLCNAGEASSGELEKYSLLLRDLGISTPVTPPSFPVPSEDTEFANNFFKAQPGGTRRWIALFAGTANRQKFYPGLGKSLRDALQPGDAVLALGSPEDHATCQEELRELSVPTANLCGKITLRQAAGLLKGCALAVGLDTGLAHLACAVACPQVVIMGGYDFGRFFPYSPLTSLVCLPLDCYHCLGECRFSEVHCIRGIQLGTVTEAIRQTLATGSAKPRIFFQKNFPQPHQNETGALPQWKLPVLLATKPPWEVIVL